jgi:hypothetical protein
MPHIFTNAEYAAVLYVYGFCDGCATAVEYRRWFPRHRIPDRRECFPRCSIHCMNVARFPVLVFHLNKHVNDMWRDRKTFLKWYSVALLLTREDFLHVSVFYEHVYGQHCMMRACTNFIHSVCTKSTHMGQCHAFRILSLVTY